MPEGANVAYPPAKPMARKSPKGTILARVGASMG